MLVKLLWLPTSGAVFTRESWCAVWPVWLPQGLLASRLRHMRTRRLSTCWESTPSVSSRYAAGSTMISPELSEVQAFRRVWGPPEQPLAAFAP